jgi:hypothetical protein
MKHTIDLRKKQPNPWLLATVEAVLTLSLMFVIGSGFIVFGLAATV